MGAKRIGAVVLGLLVVGLGGGVAWKLTRPVRPVGEVASHWPEPSQPVSPEPPSSDGRTRPGTDGRAVGTSAGSLAEPIFLLRPGETLDYQANILKLDSTIAKLKVVAVEKRNQAGKNWWHLQAFAHTENPYRMVFELDDQFDSYSEAENMTSRQYEMHLNERGQKVDAVERMLPAPNEAAPDGVGAARVLPGTRDPLGMLEYLRGTDWKTTSEVRSPVFDGRKLYDVQAVLAGRSEAVSVPAGHFRTLKIEIHVKDQGVEMKDAHFLLYLTDDRARLPVLLEAVLPVATARVELSKVPSGTSP